LPRSTARHAADKAVGRVLERHGIHRDLFGRFEVLDLALDEAEAAFTEATQLPPAH
jgi:hypothetical protein